MLSENAIKVLEKRYFRKDADGRVLEDAPMPFTAPRALR